VKQVKTQRHGINGTEDRGVSLHRTCSQQVRKKIDYSVQNDSHCVRTKGDLGKE